MAAALAVLVWDLKRLPLLADNIPRTAHVG